MSGLLEDRTGIKARTPMPVQDVTSSTKLTSIAGETVTFANGVAGTTQQIKLDYDGIMSSKGDRVGIDGDSSISWTGGTVLTTEVPWRFKNTEGKDDDTNRLATLANGEYMVDYENGYILGKNAITTSSTTDTIAYDVRLGVSTTVAGGGGDASAAKQDTGNASLSSIDGKIAAGAAGADGESNATTMGSLYSRLKGFNGTTWDRLRTAVTTVSATLTGFLNTLPWAIYNATPTVRTEAQGGPLQADANGSLRTTQTTAIAGEDFTNNVLRVEGQFSGTQCTGDTQVKASAGFVHAIIVQSTDAVPTAGTIILYDNTAESGTQVVNLDIKATAPVGEEDAYTIIIDRLMTTGIYVGFTTTTDVAVQVIYR